jgi:hypothetical protein
MAIMQKQNTQIQLERQGKKKKNTKHHKTTTYGSEPTNPIKKKYKPKSTNPIKKQIEKNIAFLKHKPQQNHNGAKNKIRAQDLNRRLGEQSIGEMKR